MILQLLIVTVAGWINRHQQQVIICLQEENRVFKSKLPRGRLRLTDTERRRLAAHFDGVLLGKRYLLRDRDSKFTESFDAMLNDSGIEPVVLPPQSPNLNAHCERFVRSIKEEALGRMILVGEASLRYAIRTYMHH